MSNISFILTEKCDWECEYCYFTHIEQKEPKFKTFQKHLPYIKKTIDRLGDDVSIDIQGGEIGIMPIEILEYFLATLDRKIVFSTNGTFLSKKTHLNKKIRPYIKSIMWHMTDNFDKKNIIKDYHDNEIFISRGIVHNNINEIVDFLKTNNHILFDYVEFEFDIKYPRKVNYIMYHELLKELIKLNNITLNAREILQRRLYEKDNHRNNCIEYNHSIVIDMVNETICLCQRQPDVNIELTEENLIYRLKTFPKDLWIDGIKTSCNSCTRLYSSKFQGNSIENTLRNRKIL
jgi:organic radical activating enzyme